MRLLAHTDRKAMDTGRSPSGPSIRWPLALSFIGAPLALAGNFLAAGVALLGGSSHAWDVAAAWAPFWGSLSVYPLLTLLLVWRSRQEGFSVGELLSYRPSKLALRRWANHCSGMPTMPSLYPCPPGSLLGPCWLLHWVRPSSSNRSTVVTPNHD